MALPTGETTATLRATVGKVRDEHVTFLAGSLAYSAFVSLVPLLLLLLLAAGTVGDEALTSRIRRLTESFLTPEAQSLVTDAISNTSGQTGLSVAGVLVLLWGALRLFRGLDTAFAEVYETTNTVTLLTQFRDGLIAFTSVVVSLLAVGLAGGAFAYLDLPLLHLLNPLFLLAGLTFAFFPMFYVFPNLDLAWREALPGAVVAAGGWAILEVVFQLYAATAGRYEAYGVIGGVLLLVTWLYAAGFVLLVGAALNAVVWERGHPETAAEILDGATEADEDGGDSSPSPPTVEPATAAVTRSPGGSAASPVGSSGRRSHDSAPGDGRSARPTGTATTTGAAATDVADVAPMGARTPPSEEFTTRSGKPTTRPENAATRPERSDESSAIRPFLVGVVVGACGSIAFGLAALWRWWR